MLYAPEPPKSGQNRTKTAVFVEYKQNRAGDNRLFLAGKTQK
jgi:hypothetical protein